MRRGLLRSVALLGCALWAATRSLGCDDAASKATPADGDKDGLSDVDEVNLYGTSPILADTDGDGLSDFDEIILHGFDPKVAAFPFNPRLADLPLMNVRILGPPLITLRLIATTGETWSYTISRTVSESVAVTASVTETQSFSDTFTISDTINRQESLTFNAGSVVVRDAGVEDAGIPDPVTEDDAGVPIETPEVVDPGGPEIVTLSSGVASTLSYSNTTGVTLSFTQSETRGLGYAITEAQSYALTHSLTVSGGLIEVLAEVENQGNLPFTIGNLLLAASLVSPEGIPIPIGNLDVNTQNFTFVPWSIAPGARQGPMNFLRDGLTLDQLAALADTPDALNLRVGIYELLDAADRPYVFDTHAIQSRTATLIIDYGGQLPRERYLVATNLDPGNPGVTMRRALREIIQLPYEDDRTQGLTSVSYVTTGDTGRWLVEHRRNQGRQILTTAYEAPYDFSSILLRAGDVITLRWVPP